MSDEATAKAGPFGHVAFAVGLIVVVALAFWGLGNLRDGTPATDDPPPTAAPDAEDGGDVDAGDGSADPPDAEPSDDDATDAPSATDGEADGDGEPDDGEGDDDEVGDGEVTRTLEPADVAVQVLDGTTGDGTAASAVAEELREAGYNVVAENPALDYAVTTVFWTETGEQGARQVAAELGADEVAAQPGTLSESVDVHVVVGDDRLTTD